MKLLAVTIMLYSLAYSPASQECKCGAPERDATTRKGYSESVIVQPTKRYKKLSGVVSLSDTPIEGALVELFPYSKDYSRKRLAACLTGADGHYCFAGVSKGRYEIRVSKDGGWEITHVNVYVDPTSKRASDAELGLPIELGK